MSFRELVQIALSALLANKLRTFLTALGIIIGIASVISMLAIGNGAKSSVESRISSLGANIITVSPGSTTTGIVAAGSGSSTTLVLGDYQAIKDAIPADQAKNISPEQGSNQQLIYKDKNTNVTVTAVSEDYLPIRNYTLKDGAFFSSLQNKNAARVIVLGSGVVDSLFSFENPINKQVQIGNQLFTVIGILNSKGQSGFTNQDDIAFIPIQTSQKILNGNDSLRSIVVKAEDPNNIPNLEAQIYSIMFSRHNTTDLSNPDFTVNTSQDALNTLSSITDTFTYLLAGIAGISLLVGGIGIMNTMIISITERTREIGLRKAIGANDRSIMLQFIVESVVLSSLGAIFGIILGIIISIIINSLGSSLTAEISLSSIVLAASISMFIGLVFGIYPARKAARLNPIDALRYE